MCRCIMCVYICKGVLLFSSCTGSKHYVTSRNSNSLLLFPCSLVALTGVYHTQGYPATITEAQLQEVIPDPISISDTRTTVSHLLELEGVNGMKLCYVKWIHNLYCTRRKERRESTHEQRMAHDMCPRHTLAFL